jgi:hypothetical protein
MMIDVLFHGEEESQQIPAHTLGQLIAMGKVKAFLRSSGWAVIGRDPIREPGKLLYFGTERRNRRKTYCMSCPEMVGGSCTSTTCPDRYKQVKFFT